MTLAADMRLDICPYCKGSRVRVHKYNNHGEHHRSQCLQLGCGALGPIRPTEEEAIEAHNQGAKNWKGLA